MGVVVDLRQIVVRLVYPSEKQTYQALMAQHHYLGSLPKISETLWYVACWHDQWVALLSFSASALKCAVRDSWIGWGMHNRYDRLKLIVNNSRFLILPDWHRPNLGSRVLSLCTSWIGTSMKIEAVFAPDTGQKTSVVCVALSLASSNRKRSPVSLKKCAS
jgi:hypothetical protein